MKAPHSGLWPVAVSVALVVPAMLVGPSMRLALPPLPPDNPKNPVSNNAQLRAAPAARVCIVPVDGRGTGSGRGMRTIS